MVNSSSLTLRSVWTDTAAANGVTHSVALEGDKWRKRSLILVVDGWMTRTSWSWCLMSLVETERELNEPQFGCSWSVVALEAKKRPPVCSTMASISSPFSISSLSSSVFDGCGSRQNESDTGRIHSVSSYRRRLWASSTSWSWNETQFYPELWHGGRCGSPSQFGFL